LEINDETHVSKIIVPEEEKRILFENFCMIIFANFVQIGWMDLFVWLGQLQRSNSSDWSNWLDESL